MPLATIVTSEGSIAIELYKDDAPETVENFIQYIKDKFYNGTVFHRVIGNFMIQGGGYEENGKGKIVRGTIKSEAANGLKNNKGTLAMARRASPDSATSQFFINTNNNDSLNNSPKNEGYTVFGKVTSGMEIIDKIRLTKTTTKNSMKDWPEENIVIQEIYLNE